MVDELSLSGLKCALEVGRGKGFERLGMNARLT